MTERDQLNAAIFRAVAPIVKRQHPFFEAEKCMGCGWVAVLNDECTVCGAKAVADVEDA